MNHLSVLNPLIVPNVVNVLNKMTMLVVLLGQRVLYVSVSLDVLIVLNVILFSVATVLHVSSLNAVECGGCFLDVPNASHAHSPSDHCI